VRKDKIWVVYPVGCEIDSGETALANLVLADEVAYSNLDDWGLTTAVTCRGAV